jgi:hypothetical protein
MPLHIELNDFLSSCSDVETKLVLGSMENGAPLVFCRQARQQTCCIFPHLVTLSCPNWHRRRGQSTIYTIINECFLGLCEIEHFFYSSTSLAQNCTIISIFNPYHPVFKIPRAVLGRGIFLFFFPKTGSAEVGRDLQIYLPLSSSV